MSAKKVIITVVYSVIIGVTVSLSNGIINPFKKDTGPGYSKINPYRNFRPVKKRQNPAQIPEDFYEKLISINQPMPMPGPYDWLAQHPEPGQPYSEYIKEKPTIPDEQHNTIYISLLGEFTDTQKEIIDVTAEFISLFYMMPVKFTEPISTKTIDPKAQRTHPMTKDRQILAPYVLEEMVKPVVQDDAFCTIAFTASDLWPGEGWNFVFGLASMEDRIGIWSIYRNGDPSKSPEDYQLCLRRTLKTGTHEIGHMFSLQHCIYFHCNLNGSNHRKESDSQPLWLCPVCLKKLQWAESFSLKDRYQKLIAFCRKHGLADEAKFYRKSLKLLQETSQQTSQ